MLQFSVTGDSSFPQFKKIGNMFDSKGLYTILKDCIKVEKPVEQIHFPENIWHSLFDLIINPRFAYTPRFG